ncbi:MAG: 50S ribosomal protein L11 methyltransferase, partial [Clostridia bacterium]|nr:50S ribosomal protein L11 methyltransferase [Clostridia bacterium]
ETQVQTRSALVLHNADLFINELNDLLSDIVVRLAPDVPRVMKDGGLIAVSGIIDTQRDRVADALTAAGLTLRAVRTENDWVAMLFGK